MLGLYKKGPITIVNDKPRKIYYVKLVIRFEYLQHVLSLSPRKGWDNMFKKSVHKPYLDAEGV